MADPPDDAGLLPRLAPAAAFAPLADIQTQNDDRPRQEEGGRNVNIRIWFSPAPLLLGTGVFAACTAWLAFGPDTSGPVGRALSSNGHALTIVAVGIGLTMTLLFGFPAIRMAFGMPALLGSDDALRVYVLPFERFRWSEVSDVKIRAGKLLIVTRAGRNRSVNLALLGDCDAAVAEMQEVLAEQQRPEHPRR